MLPQVPRPAMTFAAGDAVNVLSRSEGRWRRDGVVVEVLEAPATVDGTALPAGTVKVIYAGGEAAKWVPPKAFAMELQAADFAAGDQVSVFVRTMGLWVSDGMVQQVLAEPQTIDGHPLPAGSVLVHYNCGSSAKWVPPEVFTEELRPLRDAYPEIEPGVAPVAHTPTDSLRRRMAEAAPKVGPAPPPPRRGNAGGTAGGVSGAGGELRRRSKEDGHVVVPPVSPAATPPVAAPSMPAVVPPATAVASLAAVAHAAPAVVAPSAVASPAALVSPPAAAVVTPPAASLALEAEGAAPAQHSQWLLEQMQKCVLVHHQLSCLLIHGAALGAGFGTPDGQSNGTEQARVSNVGASRGESVDSTAWGHAIETAAAMHDQQDLKAMSHTLEERLNEITRGLQAELAAARRHDGAAKNDAVSRTPPAEEAEERALQEEIRQLEKDLQRETEQMASLQRELDEVRCTTMNLHESLTYACFDEVRHAEDRNNALEGILVQLSSGCVATNVNVAELVACVAALLGEPRGGCAITAVADAAASAAAAAGRGGRAQVDRGESPLRNGTPRLQVATALSELPGGGGRTTVAQPLAPAAAPTAAALQGCGGSGNSGDLLVRLASGSIQSSKLWGM